MSRLRTVITLLLLTVTAWVMAQSARDDFRKNLRQSGCNFLAYPGPQQQPLTPAPAGKHPFYISHYGRHGSRFQTKAIDYDYAFYVMCRADSAGALNDLGRDVLARLTAIRNEAQGRLGDLTPLGAQQHRDIARRMVERFPEVFAGSAVVDARSTTTPRCILSMAAAMQQLLLLNPQLNISMDASEHDLYYMKHAYRGVNDPEAKDCYRDFCARHQCWQRVVTQLFADTAYMNRYVNGERLCFYLFREASNLQSSDISRAVTLYDLFTDDEVYHMWAKENASWFLGFGLSDLCEGDMPYSQSNLLRNIISQADSCLQLQAPGCTLRYGHETMVLPLVCLLNLDGYGQRINDLDQLERRGWLSHRIFPMACNVQFIFYRSDVADPDVLVKVLLNENEATLPLKTDQAPYYHWADVRSYYLNLLHQHDNR